jgi:hypothetical protein
MFLATMFGVVKPYSSSFAAHRALASFIQKNCNYYWADNGGDVQLLRGDFDAAMGKEDYYVACEIWNQHNKLYNMNRSESKALVSTTTIDKPF